MAAARAAAASVAVARVQSGARVAARVAAVRLVKGGGGAALGARRRARIRTRRPVTGSAAMVRAVAGG